MTNKRLGRLRKPGECFDSVSNRMIKIELWSVPRGNEKPVFKIHRAGEYDFFVNKGRRYYCEVLGIVETKTGLCCKYLADKEGHTRNAGPRWWQFTYRVRVIEN